MKTISCVVLCIVECFILHCSATAGEKETIAAILQGNLQRRKQFAGLVFEYECCRKYNPHAYWNSDEGGIREEFGVWFNETLMIRFCDENIELPFAYHWSASYKENLDPDAAQEASWADDVWGDKRLGFSNWNKTSRFWFRPARGKEMRLRDFSEPHAFLDKFLSKGLLHDDSVTAHYLTGCDFAEALFFGSLSDPHGKNNFGVENRLSLGGTSEVAGIQCTVLKLTDPAYGEGEDVIANSPDFLLMKSRNVRDKTSYNLEVTRVARFDGVLYPVDMRITQEVFTHAEVEIKNVRVRRITEEDLGKWDFPFPSGTFVNVGPPTIHETVPWPEGFEERVNVAFMQNFRIKHAKRNYLAIGGFTALVIVIGIIVYRRRNK